MPEFWDLKVVADSEDEVRSVLAQTAALVGLEPLQSQVAVYPEFPRMWTCAFEARPSVSDPLTACAERFAKLAAPSWEHRRSFKRDGSTRERESYEAISDCRTHLFAVPGVFWARVYCELRAPRSATGTGEAASDLA